MALRSELKKEVGIKQGIYRVIGFVGMVGSITYHHKDEENVCVVSETKGSLDVLLKLCPDSDKNPYLSVKSEYKIILKSVKFEKEGEHYKVHLSKAVVQGAFISIGRGWMSVNQCVDAEIFSHEIARGALNAKVKSGEDGSSHLDVEVHPQHCDQGPVAKLLGTLGLLSVCKLTATLKPEMLEAGKDLKSRK